MKARISLWQLALLSTGGMIGCGWLFSPYYGYQAAGIGVVISWLITALITLIIGLSFAEVCAMLPIVGGVSRFVSITHNRTTAFIFLVLGWLSYVVYLPLEAQSVIQYLGFWFDALVSKTATTVELSVLGFFCAVLVIGLITWFNTLVITKVTKTNAVISIWKIIIPLLVAFIVIICFGSWGNVFSAHNFTKFTGEHVFLAITDCGLAFAFSGFQNGLILANQVKNPKKSLPFSLFIPIAVGLVMFLSLSLAFLSGLSPTQHLLMNAVAPLLGLLALLGLNILFTILFIDAVLAPLGTTNVYIAATSRLLLGFGNEFLPTSWLTRLNRNQAPVNCLWLNAIIGIVFLLPFPTWTQLVSFLSSIVVFAYLAGPVSLLVLRSKVPGIERTFRVKYHKIIGYLGFICCSLLIYWSGLLNLIYLLVILLITIVIYGVVTRSLLRVLISNSYLLFYVFGLVVVSKLRAMHHINFPLDNVLVCIIGITGCYLFTKSSLPVIEIQRNLDKINLEIKNDAVL